MLWALGAGAWKNWDANLAEATWLVNSRGSDNHTGPAEIKPLYTVGGDKVLTVHMGSPGKWLGRAVWVAPTLGKNKPICVIVFTKGWVMQKDGDIRCVPRRDLILGETNL